MEIFENLDWIPNLEDMLNDKFLNDERLKNESSIYNILNGNFYDPFYDIKPPDYKPIQEKIQKNQKTNTSSSEKRSVKKKKFKTTKKKKKKDS
ncbi:PREDICTED: uncharacterized protein LOC105361803 [Ceratosolen solmsi marchali]|uniref:Uncharacterized protein LOC105361803 n=1 Tax=Ceratosolen solmsi marchali TaxID=326594 RepID=A0AAJ7DUZ3_9HYME|nr:PREDICTED: uncharacterized protein LOC105361803 [Ceratosolen solmsi marchali]